MAYLFVIRPSDARTTIQRTISVKGWERVANAKRE